MFSVVLGCFQTYVHRTVHETWSLSYDSRRERTLGYKISDKGV